MNTHLYENVLNMSAYRVRANDQRLAYHLVVRAPGKLLQDFDLAYRKFLAQRLGLLLLLLLPVEVGEYARYHKRGYDRLAFESFAHRLHNLAYGLVLGDIAHRAFGNRFGHHLFVGVAR